MPIIDLQMRMRQLGEIRIGHAVKTGRTSEKTGKEILRPAKLNAFRFTSSSREILTSVATLYGGEVQPWTPANGGPTEFEVYSKAARLPVLIPPRDAVSQWYEHYSGSKCVRRCDGQTEHKSDKPCMCNPEKRTCKMTTRVNIMLRDVPALGQWLLISKGYYAGVTLPPAAELLAQVGGYVAGWLGMEEKLVVLDEGPARFMIPTLDVEITPAELMAGKITGAPAVTKGEERAAITAGTATAAPAAGPRRDYLVEAKQAATQAEVLALFTAAKNEGAPLAYQEQLKAIGLTKPAAPEQAGPIENHPEQPDATGRDEVHEAEIVEEDDITDAWFQVVAAAGARGWSGPDVEQKFAAAHGGLMPATSSPAQLRAFAVKIKAGEVQ
jgi:hypothetical protein